MFMVKAVMRLFAECKLIKVLGRLWQNLLISNEMVGTLPKIKVKIWRHLSNNSANYNIGLRVNGRKLVYEWFR